MRQEQGNNLCGYYVCEWIDNYVSEKGQMTPEAFTVSVHNINFLFASYVIQIFIFF